MSALDDIISRYQTVQSPYTPGSPQAYDSNANDVIAKYGVNPGLLGNKGPPASFWQKLQNGAVPILGNQDLALSLLANSGPSPQPRSFGQVLGQSGLQANQIGQQRQNAQLSAIMQQAQISHLLNPPRKPVPVVGADGKIRYSDEESAIGQEVGQLNAGANVGRDRMNYDLYAQQERAAGREPAEFNDWHQQWLDQQPVNPQIVTAGGGVSVVQPTRGGGVKGRTDLSTPAQEVTFTGSKAKSEADAQKMAARNSEYVDTGVAAAKQVAVLKRSIELLDSVSTGGLDNVRLSLTNLLGVTGADEAELSANTGKAVLAQLRPTFGAQFTKAEGDRLASIEAGFGKSSEANKRLLKQALQIATQAAERGYDAAQELNDGVSSKAIERYMRFSLTPKEGQ